MATWLRTALAALFLTLFGLSEAAAQQSIARRWNDLCLQAIREDLARPPVQARNLFHLSIAMYDAWAAYDTVAQPFMLGKTYSGYTTPFLGIARPADVEAARQEAISHAAYRLLFHRFRLSPNASQTIPRFIQLMDQLGYDPNFVSTDYSTGSPAALGNYIATAIISMGFQDGSNEVGNYLPTDYVPVNPSLNPNLPGNPDIKDPNRWQPLNVPGAVDQNGNPIPAIQRFQSPEWGRVTPFAMTAADRDTFYRAGVAYKVYHDPGPPALLDTTASGDPSEAFKWNYALCSIWSAHLDPADGVLWDISPASIGNNQSPMPSTLAEYQSFYKTIEGGAAGDGRPLNPKTSLPYTPQIVPRADYTRVLAQFWADGPNSETPPGHWFAIFNKAMDHPDFVRRFNGKGHTLDPTEYDVKAYLALGGALHDAAISAWSIKGWYDSGRPITNLRYMADRGQSTDPGLPRYHPAGVPLIPGYIESVMPGDPLAGNQNGQVGKIKLKAFRGPKSVANPVTDVAGVGWILAENWWPYQRSTFVTPPFAGYISGHSTYSRSAAEALTLITGDEYFPGGMGEFKITANSGFLGLEKGPSTDVALQWATYRDASDQTSLSRIWGGIHPPVDDIPGRIIGAKCGTAAYHFAKALFYPDSDGDGYVSLDDCDDHNPSVYPGAPELCDLLDNNCNGFVDETLPLSTYYADADSDGYGNPQRDSSVACSSALPQGFVANALDCDDNDATTYPGAPEICDDVDNDCNGFTDDNTPLFTYYADHDSDGYGALSADSVITCSTTSPSGYVANALDCNDSDAAIYPGAPELCDNVDNDCNGFTDDGIPYFTYYADADSDGYGKISPDSLLTCSVLPPSGYAANALDCNDSDAAIYPGAPELCDNLDNDCNGLTDDGIPYFTYYADADGDGYGKISPDSLLTCSVLPPSGYAANALDCDDSNAATYPGAPEICDDLDNDCNGLTDDGIPYFTYYADADGDGYGKISSDSVFTCSSTAPNGYVANALDCDDSNAAVYPSAPELCDNLDNDCNGSTDDGIPYFTYYADTDGDGYGSDSLLTCVALPPVGYVGTGGDCNDINSLVNPGAQEVLDGLDNDCNGLVDDISAVRELTLTWSVQPNPVQDILLIESPHQGSIRFEVFDLRGQRLHSESLEHLHGHYTLDFSAFPSGVYVLRAFAPEGVGGALRVMKE